MKDFFQVSREVFLQVSGLTHQEELLSLFHSRVCSEFLFLHCLDELFRAGFSLAPERESRSPSVNQNHPKLETTNPIRQGSLLFHTIRHSGWMQDISLCGINCRFTRRPSLSLSQSCFEQGFDPERERDC